MRKMSKRGFTLVELLTAIVIIALLSGIGIISYQSFFKSAEERYYDVLESNILLSGNDYFEDHREKLPVGSGYGEISLLELMSARYIDQIVDSSGKPCNEGSVFAYRENGKYKYEVCLISCGNHISMGKYCTPEKPNTRIEINSETASGGDYNVLKSYNSQEYSKGEDIRVYLSMDATYNISKYVITNTSGGTPAIECLTNGTNDCSALITKTGTYKVVSYENNREISNRYFSVKIAKGTPTFTLTGDDKYLIDTTACGSNNKTKKVTIHIGKQTHEEYKTVMYQVKRFNENEAPTTSEWKEPRGLTIEETLGSGHYEIQVVVQNYSNQEQGEQTATFSFDVTYLINLEYEDGSPTGTFEVVKDQKYNYLSDSGKGDPLPETKSLSGTDVEIKWYRNDSRIYPSVNTVVDDCTYTIVGKTSIPVSSDDIVNASYCKGSSELKYTGSDITLTNSAPDHITFNNTTASSVGSHTVQAHVDFPQYIWSDGSSADKEFSCTIVKGDNPLQITDNQVWETSTSSSAQTNTFIGATGAAGSVHYEIVSQVNSNDGAVNYFTIPSSDITNIQMAGGTPKDTYTVVIRATADGDANYNSGHKDMSMTVSVGVNTNPITVTTPQSWNPSFATSDQTYDFTAANNAVGNVTYTIHSQTNASGNTVDYFRIANSGTATIKMLGNTPVGNYVVEINARAEGDGATYGEGTKKISLEITVGLQKCNKPTSVSISNKGKVTWTPSSNCSEAQHQIKIGDGTYENASSGVDKYNDILNGTGSVTVYVKALAPNSDYADSEAATASINICTATLTKGTGISSVTSVKKYLEGESIPVSATVTTGYTFSKWTQTSGGTQVSTANPYSTTACNIAYTANATANSYTLNYTDNLFVATTNDYNGIVATYTESGSYLTLNGTNTGTSNFYGTSIWNYDRRTINSGDQYNITINYISGSYSRKDTSKNARFYIELTKDGSLFSDRDTGDAPWKILNLPTSGSASGTLTVAASRASANGFRFRLHEQSAGNTTFNDYKVQIIVTKVHSKSVKYNAAYGTLDTPTKVGFDFAGWYTAMTGGSKVTSETVNQVVGNQTLYARWTSHKLKIRINGNGSATTWCGTGTTYEMDSDKYAIRSANGNPAHTVAYGQYISYSVGLVNYNNANGVCFNKAGYKAVSDAEYFLSTNSDKTYDHTDTTLTAIGMASDAGCTLKTTSECTMILKVNWTKYYPTVTLSKTSGRNCKGNKFTYTVKANVAGTFTISSGDTSIATVSPKTITAKANTEYTVTVTGAKSAAVTISNTFDATSTAYSNKTVKVNLSEGSWHATGGGSQGTKCSTAEYARCTDEGKGINFCCMHNCNVNGVIHSSSCSCGAP